MPGSDSYSDESFEDYDDDSFEEFDESPGNATSPRPPAARQAEANGHAQASIEDSLVAAIHAENRAIQERAQAKQKAKLEAARPRDALSVQAQPGQAGAVSLSLPTREQLGLSAAALQRRDATLERFRHLTAEAGVKLAPTDPRTLLSMEPKSEADLKRHGHGRFAPTRSRDAGVTAGAVTAESGGQTDEVEGAEAEVQVPEDSMGVGQAVAEARPAAGFRGGMSADDPLESPGVSGEVSRPGPDAERLRSAGRAEAGPATEPAAWLSEAAEGVRVRLAAMVPEAAGIICQLLDERDARRSRLRPPAALGKAPPRAASPGDLPPPLHTLGPGPALSGRPISCVCFASPTAPAVLVVAYRHTPAAQTSVAERGWGSKGVLAVWDLARPQAPRAILVCEGSPSAVCWADPDGPTVVVAGMEEGGLCCWDLRDAPGLVRPEALDGDGRVVHALPPAFSTEAAPWATHHAGVVGLRSLGGAGTRGSGAVTPLRTAVGVGGEMEGAAGHVASADSSGRVCVWAVVESAPSRAARGALGPGPGREGQGPFSVLRMEVLLADVPLGREALFRSARSGPGHDRRDLDAGPAGARQWELCHGMEMRAGGEVLVAVASGRVLRGATSGRVAVPKEFVGEEAWASARLREGGGQVARAECRAVACSTALPGVLAAGYSDGSVAVYSDRHATPRLVFPAQEPSAVRALQWSPVLPGVLYALNSASVLHVFDLLADRSRPVKSVPLLRARGADSQAYATTLSVSRRAAPATGQALAVLAVGMTDGSCEISVLPGVEGRPDAGAEAEQALGYLRKVSGSHLVT